MSNDFFVITKALLYKTKYVFHRDDLIKSMRLPDSERITDRTLLQWAEDVYHGYDLSEFSRTFISEETIDKKIVSEFEMVHLFDELKPRYNLLHHDEKIDYARDAFKRLVE